MKSEDFDLLSRLVRDRSGLVLTPDKSYLLESRLMPVARKIGVKGLDELVVKLRQRSDASLERLVVEAMTTNETLFFRDTKPFEQLTRLVLPNLLEKRAAKRQIRVWCAAASTGQEPYSIAIALKEEGAKVAGWKIELLGTDINLEVIERARAAVYSQFEVQRGLPIKLLVKYFKQMDGDKWQLNQEIRDMVQYREFNLLHDMKSLGQFDVVFCRNVLIYFDQPTKAQVLERIAELLPDDGVLYLGGAETVLGVTDRFEPIPNERGLYRPVRKK
ncbi:MAG: chemotaxis protein CheR [Alphaproteobacteria bacterium]|nr:protein-glutamate O-methyltransferase [Alphaproteobacteria bacterium]TAD90672.1 MAG: chemotaxis protein CheR [Alphaproteobacteria bacterium]